MSGGGLHRSIVALVVAIGVLASAPVVVADPIGASPTAGQRADLQSARGPAVANVTATRSTGADTLRFSTVDVVFAVLAGGCLVLLGAALSRLSARRPRD